MAPILYMVPPSPPVRAVKITAKAIGLELEEKIVDLSKRDQLKPEFLKMNPQHTVPTLKDEDGFTIWDSHAINAYLISKYSESDGLYPADLKKRARVDQRLHFDSGVAVPMMANIVGAIFRGEKSTIDEKDVESIENVYAFLEAFLMDQNWMAGDDVTIADYNLFSTVSTLDVLREVDGGKFPGLRNWMERMGELPECEANNEGLALFESYIKSKLT